MLLGYARVSKSDGSQCLDMQLDALREAGVDDRKIYTDQASGKLDSRPGLDACLKALREGDTLVVWRLDRIGRSLKHLVEVVEELGGRGVGFRVLTGAPVDTTSASGKLVFNIFASLAEFERQLISERTKAGLAAARARGRNGGRRYKLTAAKLRMAQAAMKERECDVSKLADDLGVSRQLLYRHIGPDGVLRPDGEKLLEKSST